MELEGLALLNRLRQIAILIGAAGDDWNQVLQRTRLGLSIQR